MPGADDDRGRGLRLNRVAGRCRQLLDDAAARRIADFVSARQGSDGGFRGRAALSDLYYTLFAVDCLLALGREPAAGPIRRYLDGFDGGDGLDLVHLCCLARCRARVGDDDGVDRAVVALDRFRHPRGGFRLRGGEPSVYGGFLVMLTAAECGRELTDPGPTLAILEVARRDDGSFADPGGGGAGTTTVTAAGALMELTLGIDPGPLVRGWLADRRGRHGGFCASAAAATPDLLSTAAALLALQALGCRLDRERETTPDFVEALWEPDGGFAGHPFEHVSDCEYTYYALLALGVLAGEP